MNFQKINDFRSSLCYRPWGILVGVSVSYPTRAVAQLLGESRAYGSVYAPSQWETTLQCPVTMQHCLSLADKMVPVIGTLGHLQTVRSFQYNMMYWTVYTYFKNAMNSPPSTKTRVLPIQSWSLDMDTTTLPSILYFWDDELSSGSLVHETKLIEARNTKHSEHICMIESILSIFITKPSKPTRSSPDYRRMCIASSNDCASFVTTHIKQATGLDAMLSRIFGM